MTAGDGIVDMAADVDIIGRVEFRGGGIVDGMDNALVDWHDMLSMSVRWGQVVEW